MRLRIGLDFDNTIANYDSAFPLVAQQIGVNTSAKNKRDLKKELFKAKNGEEIWQRVQGLTYGKNINLANLQPGFLEFVLRARAENHEIFIVSHKSELGHFDVSQTNLRQAALDWLIHKGIVGDSAAQVNAQNVYFESTRDKKVKKINSLKLDLFIDDLAEVLTHSAFSKSVKKILFSSDDEILENAETIQSWRDISFAVLGGVTAFQVLSILKHTWPELEISLASQVVGRGNSKIFKVVSNFGNLVLKVYPDLSTDSRPRRETEWEALNLTHQNKLQTPIPLCTSQDLNWSLIEWIEGNSPEKITKFDLQRAKDFVRALVQVSQPLNRSAHLARATEACLSPFTLEKQIETRIGALSSVDDHDLRTFVDFQLVPIFKSAVSNAKSNLGDNYYKQIPAECWVLSPSDFGLHNAIVNESGDIFFLDFEYFGWDDPVKMTVDFCLHPAMNLDHQSRDYWIEEMASLFEDDISFKSRLNLLFPLYITRWSLIILNEFRADKLKNRVNAQDTIRTDIKRTQMDQLEKAKLMLKNAKIWIK